MLETLDYAIRIGSTPTFLYFDLKFKMTSDKGKPPKKKAKRNNIRWDAIYANKISFHFIDKLFSTFPRFF